MKISGAVCYSILKNPKNNKYIILLGDIHDGVEYCEEESICVDEYLDKLLDKNIDVILEEVPRDGVTLVELWPNAKHTQKLKDWFLSKTKDIIAIDIRPYLVPFSYHKREVSELDEKEKNIIMTEYLRTLDCLFELNKKCLDKSIIFFKNIINLLGKKSEQSGICKMYKELRLIYLDLKSEIDDIETITFEEQCVKDSSFFIKLEKLKIDLMDWYTVLLLLNNRNSITHFGLAHYINVKKVLIDIFNFEVIIDSGINELSDKLKKLDACIDIADDKTLFQKIIT